MYLFDCVFPQPAKPANSGRVANWEEAFLLFKVPKAKFIVHIDNKVFWQLEHFQGMKWIGLKLSQLKHQYKEKTAVLENIWFFD